jgi:hypothetical protein
MESLPWWCFRKNGWLLGADYEDLWKEGLAYITRNVICAPFSSLKRKRMMDNECVCLLRFCCFHGTIGKERKKNHAPARPVVNSQETLESSFEFRHSNMFLFYLKSTLLHKQDCNHPVVAHLKTLLKTVCFQKDVKWFMIHISSRAAKVGKSNPWANWRNRILMK